MDTEKRKANLIRPGTLVQVLQLVHEGENLRFCMAGFLDGFYGDTEAEPLRRASMARDGRWWAYETIRSGLAPTAEEQRELAHAGAPAFG